MLKIILSFVIDVDRFMMDVLTSDMSTFKTEQRWDISKKNQVRRDKTEKWYVERKTDLNNYNPIEGYFSWMWYKAL